MKTKIFAVRDTAVESFMQPMFLQSEGAVRRSFADEVNRSAPDNVMFHHPEHFQLYYLGEYDNEFGILTPLSAPVFIVDAVSCKS